MRSLLFNYKQTINIILPVVITAAIFYSGSLEQRISEIQSDYMIDTNTLNNSFITFSINLHAEDAKVYQKTKNDLSAQMSRFNEKYEREEKERRTKKLLQKWIDRAIYALTFSLIMFNVLATSQNTHPDREA